MKKLLLTMLAVGALAMVPAVDAKCGKKSCAPRKSCKKPCAKPCTPKCTTDVQKRIVMRPCTKTVQIEGVCPHEICTKVTTCQTESQKCVGPCEGGCANGVTAADRGETAGRGASMEVDEIIVD